MKDQLKTKVDSKMDSIKPTIFDKDRPDWWNWTMLEGLPNSHPLYKLIVASICKTIQDGAKDLLSNNLEVVAQSVVKSIVHDFKLIPSKETLHLQQWSKEDR